MFLVGYSLHGPWLLEPAATHQAFRSITQVTVPAVTARSHFGKPLESLVGQPMATAVSAAAFSFDQTTSS